MLDTETKRRIDTARDILVGKIPDPKAQVEQITIALIYKFMDDMDAESEEMGGKRKFFANGFGQYSWAKLMAPGMGGHETLNLYIEAISKMPENPGLPSLFREIFKNAFLPYRDPETLRAFLKIIDEFTYDHSERLGDAFEYLLSVLGSQGDAGQFRTPRHIIDFIVEIIDPKKGETVLDPACGTAGFLISAYKHIRQANQDKKGNLTLNPDEKGNLSKSFMGYDISPDMVRLSLVNMYLHGFTDPDVIEYDTLTSEEKWNEHADVILANPPFMSPKGGIKPHKRFSVQSKRSEVLFVDYMAEHLSTEGRAGIIVPEGIIFQSQNAYKQLRKMLVEDYLVAVISLPAGVFNPYSGVKTSILILDKSLAPKSDTIGFFKIDNDGFDLGAQRRKIIKDNLPQISTEITEYLRRLRSNDFLQEFQPTLGLIVPKEKIEENGEYNLSGARYENELPKGEKQFLFVELNSVCKKITDGSHFSPETLDSGFPYVTVRDLENGFIDFEGCKKIDKKSFMELKKNGCKPNRNDVLFSKDGTVGKTALINFDKDFVVLSSLAIITPDTASILPEYIYCLLSSEKFKNKAIENKSGVAIRRIVLKTLKTLQIPLPPMQVQKEIVAEIEGYQKVIDGARAVIDNYRPHIPIHPDWPMVELGKVCEIIMGQSPPGETYNKDGNGVPLINGPVEFGPEPFSKTLINQYTTKPKKLCQKDDLILCVRGSTTGRMNIAGYSGAIGRGVAAIRSKSNQLWINYSVNSLREFIYQRGVGSTFPNISLKDIAELKIPLPSNEDQQNIIEEFEAERTIVEANRELIERFEKKIQNTLARVWGEEESDSGEA